MGTGASSLAKANKDDVLDADGKARIHWAAQTGDLETITLLAAQNMNLGQETKDGLMAIHFAAQYNHTAVIDLLDQLGQKSSFNKKATKHNQNTPLHFAASHNATAAVVMLISKGVNLEQTNEFGNNAAHFGAFANHPEVIRTLYANGAKASFFNHKNKSGETPTYCAAQKDGAEAITALAESGADINLAGAEGTPLQYAIKHSKLKVVAELTRLEAANPAPQRHLPYLVQGAANGDYVELTDEESDSMPTTRDSSAPRTNDNSPLTKRVSSAIFTKLLPALSLTSDSSAAAGGRY